MSKTKGKGKRDAAMAAANDKEGQEAAEKTHVKGAVETVMAGIKEQAKKAKKMPSVVETKERRVVNVRHVFSEKELKEIAKTLTGRLCDLNQVEEEKKAVMASYGEKIKNVKLEVGKLSRNHRDGYEVREHDATVIYDYKKKEVRFRDVVTKKIIDKRPFGPGDEQRRFL